MTLHGSVFSISVIPLEQSKLPFYFYHYKQQLRFWSMCGTDQMSKTVMFYVALFFLLFE